MSDDRTLKLLRSVAQPFADILPLLTEIEKAGTLQAYVGKLTGSVESLRRDEADAKKRIASNDAEAKLSIKAARDEVAAIHAAAEQARVNGDKYLADQTSAGNAALAQAKTQATAIVEQAKNDAVRVIASFEAKTESAKAAVEDAKAALDSLNGEIAERQTVLNNINEQLETLRKRAK